MVQHVQELPMNVMMDWNVTQHVNVQQLNTGMVQLVKHVSLLYIIPVCDYERSHHNIADSS